MEESLYSFYDPSQPISYLSGNLPHWRQDGVMYFVTFRLADSIPQNRLRQWCKEKEDWLESHPEPHTEEDRMDFWRRFPARFHQWLDAGYGRCVLRHPEVKSLVDSVMRSFDEQRYRLGANIVMPNHVHAVVTPLPGFDLSAILHSWKSFSALQINRLLERSGKLWQKESFDHIVRSAHQLERINEYIRQNPVLGGKGPM